MKTITKIMLAIGILCLFAFAQEKPKAAVYIKGNPEGRDVLRMAVNTFLIKSQKYQMIAVDAIDVLAEEQNRQRGGSVSNEDIAQLGKDAGAKYVCVVERAESDGRSYVITSMVSVQSKIAELSEMSELPRGGKIISLIERQINKMLGISVPEYEPEPEPAAPGYAAEYTPEYAPKHTPKYTPTPEYATEEPTPVPYDPEPQPSAARPAGTLKSTSISFYRPSVTSFYDYKGQELRRNGLNAILDFEEINKKSLFGLGIFVGIGRLGDDIFEFNIGCEMKKLFWLWEDVIAFPATIGIGYRYQSVLIENRVVATFINEPEFLEEPEDYLDEERNMHRHNMDILPSLDLEIFFGSSFSIYAGYMYRITPFSGDWKISYKKMGETASDDYAVPETFNPLRKSKEHVFGKPGTLRFGVKIH